MRSLFRPRKVWSTAVYLDCPFPLPPGRAPDFLLRSDPVLRWPWQPHTQADPFLFAHGGALYLFFERQVADDFRRLEVARIDATGMTRLGTILAEPFDLSYPVVFEVDDTIYLMPESQGAGELRLYRFAAFPHRLELVRVLLRGRFADPSPVLIDGRWFVFVTTAAGLELYHTDDLVAGTLVPHPANPLTDDAGIRRCGGVPFRQDGRWLRPAQDGRKRYGRNLDLMAIERLSTTEYAERPFVRSVFASEHRWNAAGGHHVSLAAYAGGQAVAIDGQARDAWGHKLAMRAWMLLTGRRRR